MDPIYDQNELNVIRSNADLYVHGHSAGGTNPSLVEAMYLGLPIMTFDISYNRETTSHKAFYFRNSEDLILLLNNTGKSQLEENGKAHTYKSVYYNIKINNTFFIKLFTGYL